MCRFRPEGHRPAGCLAARPPSLPGSLSFGPGHALLRFPLFLCPHVAPFPTWRCLHFGFAGVTLSIPKGQELVCACQGVVSVGGSPVRTRRPHPPSSPAAPPRSTPPGQMSDSTSLPRSLQLIADVRQPVDGAPDRSTRLRFLGTRLCSGGPQRLSGFDLQQGCCWD